MILNFLNDLERVCASALADGATADDLHRALDEFDRLIAGFATPHPRAIALLHGALISLLGSAIERDGLRPVSPGIYAIEYSNKSVKIGCSNFFEDRLQQLSTQGGIVAVRSSFFPCRDLFQAESAAHAEFKAKRLEGEFFDLEYGLVLPCLARIAGKFSS